LVNLRPIGEEKMARGTQVSKMGKRKRVSTWGTKAKKKNKGNSMRFQLSRSDYGFPDKFVTRLKYCESINLTAAASMTNTTFRLNSIFDPNLSGVGHLPVYYDQLASLYGRYRVLGSKITVTFSVISPPSLTAVNYTPTVCGIICSNSNSLAALAVDTLMEQNDGDVKVLRDKSADGQVVCTQTFSPNRDLGNGAVDDTNAAPFGSNPTSVYYAHVFKNDSYSPANTSIQAFVKIEYLVEAFQRLEAPTGGQ